MTKVLICRISSFILTVSTIISTIVYCTSFEMNEMKLYFSIILAAFSLLSLILCKVFYPFSRMSLLTVPIIDIISYIFLSIISLIGYIFIDEFCFISTVCLLYFFSGLLMLATIFHNKMMELLDRCIENMNDFFSTVFERRKKRMAGNFLDNFKKSSPSKKYCAIMPLILSIFYFIAIADLDYGYYTFIRILSLVFLGIFIIVYGAFKESFFNFPCIASLIILILFNPIVPITFESNTWKVFDIISGLVMIVISIYIMCTQFALETDD